MLPQTTQRSTIRTSGRSQIVLHNAMLSLHGSGCPVRLAVPQHRCQRRLRTAANDEQQLSGSQSACPFANVLSDKQKDITSRSHAASLTELSGNGWKVLPQRNVQNLPQAEGNFCWNPILGEYGQLEKQGAGAFMLERLRKYGPVFTFMLGNEKMTAVVDYETIKSLLQNGDSKVMSGWMPPQLYAMLGEGSKRNLENPEIRIVSRKMMTPGFAKEALRGYLPKLEAICSKQLEVWSTRGEPVDLRAEGKALSFEFSTQLLVDFDVPEDQKADIKAKLDALFQGMFAPPIPLPGTRYTKGLAAKAELREDIKKLIRSNTREKAENSVFHYNLESRKKTFGVEELSEDSVAESGIGMIIAGNDTSGLSMTALLAILPQFPEVMEKLRQEQREVIAKHGSDLIITALDAMSYADAVVKEVLRVAPPSAQIMRRTLHDMEILGKFVPAGSLLFLSSLMGQVLTDPKLNPHITPEDLTHIGEGWYTVNASTLKQDFHPERWLTLQQQQQWQQSTDGQSDSHNKPSGLLTFSMGPHICLGLSLFMHEAKVLLSILARGYSLEADRPQDLGFDTVMVTQLQTGTKVRFSKLPASTVAAAAPVPLAR